MNTEQERAELLPCPFCGSTSIEIQISTPDREGTPTHLMCADCGAAGPWSYERGGSYTIAAAFWNARAALQSQDREDAERYRWLRAGGNDDIGVVRGFDCIDSGSTTVVGTYEEALDGEQLDEAIDHALRVEGDRQ